MPQIRPPRLYRSRLGVFYFRIKSAARDRRFSLRTKCPDTATLLALELSAALERERIMKNPKASEILANLDPEQRRKYELEIGGAKIRADGPEDHARAMEALAAIGTLLTNIFLDEIPGYQRCGIGTKIIESIQEFTGMRVLMRSDN